MNAFERSPRSAGSDLRMPARSAFEGIHDFGSAAAAAERSRRHLANELQQRPPRAAELLRRDSRSGSVPLTAAIVLAIVLVVFALAAA